MSNLYTPNHSPHPIKTVGIFGGGQLGLMLAQAALPLGIRCVFLEDAPDCPARLLGRVFKSSELDDFMAAADVFTLEFENTPLASAEALEKRATLRPSAQSLFIAQDRLNEKNLFKSLDIATVPFMAVASRADLDKAVAEIGLPLVLKTTRGGYDGKGQAIARTADELDRAWGELAGATAHAPLIAEGFINFSREVSIIAVRAHDGEMRYYPLVQNTHHQGILAKTIAPAPDTDALTAPAQSAIKKLMEHLGHVGVMALELFVTADGLLANEIAPRVHNSGHWSIEGAVCSQFENHMRAVAGLPLGNTSIVRPSVMLNIIGQYPSSTDILAITGAHLHLYDKAERTGRKIGHITVMDNDSATLADSVAQAIAALPNKLGM